MSEESQFVKNSRALHPAELALIKSIIAGKHGTEEIAEKLACYRVEDMQDGGMGSIRFVNVNQQGQCFGRSLAEAEYVDDDGVLVSITFNTDEKGDPYELDFWKVDFSALKRYPEPSDLKLKI